MSAPKQFRPGAFWSLGEIMDRFYAAELVQRVSSLHQLEDRIAANPGPGKFTAHDWEVLLVGSLVALRESADVLELKVLGGRMHDAIELTDRFSAHEGWVEVSGIDMLKLLALISDIADIASRELHGTWTLVIPARFSEFYSNAKPFGQLVFDAFESARTDIAEAGKCLALDRGTAAVFHLMRATEVAVGVLGDKLGAAVRNTVGEALPWGVIVANIKPKIDALAPGPDRDEWYKVHALLHSVNRAFRTKTAHPADRYSEEEARDAFAATKAFLQEMAERCA